LAYVVDLWKDWLDEEAQKTFAEVGYFTQKLRTASGKVYEKVNIVGVNTQPCYILNFYLWTQRNDPGGVLAWLNQTLFEIEQRGEIAIIISHIPVADMTCIDAWAKRYQALADRYQHIIRYTIFGHVHKEMHNIGRSFYEDKPIGVHYWSSSVSTWYEVNPSFRVFIVDEETMLPLRIETHYIDVKERPMPQWKLSHELTDHYHMHDLSPASFESLSNKMLYDEETAYRYQVTKSLWGPEDYVEKCGP